MKRFMNLGLISKLALLGLVTSVSLKAQTYPAFFQPAAEQTSIPTVDQGVSAAQVPNSAYNSVLLAVYSVTNALGYAVLPDGLNPVYSYIDPYDVPLINCNASTPSTCHPTVALFNNAIYIAYSDTNTHGLDVVVATPVPNGGVAYTFQLVHQDNSVQMVTAPAMAVFNGKLEIIYGSNADSNTKNAFYEVTFDGTNWTPASESNLGGSSLRISSAAKPALAVFHNQLWMCSQQNNSNHQLFVYSSPDGVSWNFVVQDTNLALGGGADMVVFNGNLVLANQQNNSNRALFVFSSPDGVNWGDQEYTGIRMGGVPALALFNSDIALLFKSNGPTTDLFTDLASQ